MKLLYPFFSFSTIVLLFFISSSGYAQEVQWASRLLSASTEIIQHPDTSIYRAFQVLGPPRINTYSGKDLNGAWLPRLQNNPRGEYISVAFAEPQHVQQIIINEALNPGAISSIELLDTNGQAYRVFEQQPRRTGEAGRLWSVKIARTPYKVTALRLDIQTAKVPGYNAIEAIGIADHHEEYTIPINVHPDMLNATIQFENLGPNVNTNEVESSPKISADGKTLYFVRTGTMQNSRNQVWASEVQPDGSFGKAFKLPAPVNSPNGHCAVNSVTPDNQTLLLHNVYKPNGQMERGVSMSHRKGDGWTFPTPLVIEDYYNNNQYAEFFLSNSGNVLLLAIERKDGYGSKDIYASFKKDNTWSPPINLGPKVNTPSSEIGPFLAADERTLYYATAGLPGYGGVDIFMTKRIGDSWTEWTEPQNLGPQLNTPGFDAYYAISADGNYVYFSSDRQGGFGRADIYRSILPQAIRPNPVVLVRGKVLNKKDNAIVPATISYFSLATGKKVGEATADAATGFYQIVLPGGDKYGFSAQHQGFIPISENLDLSALDTYSETERDLYLVPLEKGAKITMNNVYFGTGEFDLSPESFVELDELVRMMKSNPDMRVFVGGHTDNVGSPAANLTLSNNRASAVREYLLSKGIDHKRVESKGFGQTKPVVPNNSDENRQKNRRVEFEVL